MAPTFTVGFEFLLVMTMSASRAALHATNGTNTIEAMLMIGGLSQRDDNLRAIVGYEPMVPELIRASEWLDADGHPGDHRTWADPIVGIQGPARRRTERICGGKGQLPLAPYDGGWGSVMMGSVP